MNNKITIPALIAHLALKSGLSKEQSETFVKEFFEIISEALTRGESIKIKTLGTFKVMNVESRKSVNVTNGEEILIPEHKRIVFLPSKELAEEINSPFSMFESVEIHPDAEVELEESTTETTENPEKEAEVSSPIHLEETSVSESEKVSESESKSVSESEIEEIPEPDLQQPIEPEIEQTSEPEIEPISDQDIDPDTGPIEEEEMIEEPVKKGRFRFLWGFLTGLLIALIIVGLGYWFFLREGFPISNAEQDKEIVDKNISTAIPSDTIEVESMDSIEAYNDSEEGESFPDTQPSDVVVKDVIGDNYFLTTMAKKHYGNNNLWPYIYMENQDFIGHPDRIKPGTPLIIPPLSKYGVDPNNQEDIAKAKKLGEEIYKRYR